MRHPNLNSLIAFDAAARHLNFRSAADELNVTQGAIAQRIRLLERELGLLLFRRRARGVELTALGTSYHREISQGLSIIQQATKKLHTHANAVTLSVTPSFASKWLVPRLPYCVETHSDIEIKVIASEAVSDLRGQDVDIAVRQTKGVRDPGLVARELSPSLACIVASPDIARRLDVPADGEMRRQVRLETFLEQPLIQDGHRLWEAVIDENGISVSPQFMQFNQTALAIDAAVGGQGLAIAPRLLILDAVRLKRLVIVEELDPSMGQGYWVAHQSSKPSNHEARDAFVEWLIAAVADDLAASA